MLLTSITAQRGIQGATNKTLTVIETDNELRQDSIQTLAHELDHIRGGKNEALADLAGLAAKLNTDAAIIANQDTINPIKAQLGDGKDAQTTAQNQALLEGNDKTFVENHDGREGEWDYIIWGVDTEEYEDGSSKVVRTYYAERHNVYNWQARRIHDEYKKFFAQNNIDESQVSLELKKQLILDLMKEYGVSDSTFSAFEGSNFIISDDNNVVTDTLVNQTSKNYKDKFIEDILSGDVLDDIPYKKLQNDALFFNRINNSIGYEQFKSNVIEKTEKYALPAAQIVGGGAQIIAATGIEVVGCGASYGTLCIPVTALAALLVSNGSDDVATGFYNMGKKPEEQTTSFTLTQIYGLSEADANTVKLLVGSASAGGELGVAVNASRAANSAMTTSNLTQIKTAEPEQVIAIKIIDVENRLEDFKNIGSAYNKMPSHSTVNHTTDNMLVYNNVNVDNPSFGIHATRDFTAELGKPVVHRAENINAGQVTDRDGLIRVGDVKSINDKQVEQQLKSHQIYKRDNDGNILRDKNGNPIVDLNYHPTGYPAWKPGTEVVDRVLDKPERMRMVIDKDQLDKLMGIGEEYKRLTPEQRKQALGGWATQEPINSVADMRQHLAVTEEFKSNIAKDGTPNQFYVVEFEVQAGVGIREGIAGTMYDGKTGQVMPGGVKQINFVKESVHTDPDKFIIDFDSIKEIK